MRFIWERGKKRRKRHIMRFTATGEMTMTALCAVDHAFNTSSNLPFGKVCKRCMSLRAVEVKMPKVCWDCIDEQVPGFVARKLRGEG